MGRVLKVRLLLFAWLAVLAGCAPSSHVVRYRTASGAVWTYHPKSRTKPIEVSEQRWVFAEKEAADFARALFARPENKTLVHVEVVHIPPRVP